MNDDELITALQQKCPEATNNLVKIYGDRLLGAAYLLCHNEATAQDLTQDTLVETLQSINKFQRKSRLYTWMYGILFNKYRTYCKKEKLSFSSLFWEEKSSLEIETDSIDNSKISKALKKLSIKHRQIIILRYYEDMKMEDIANYLEITKGTVKSRLHHATKKLRNLLQKDSYDQL